jgi:hypothetical protein
MYKIDFENEKKDKLFFYEKYKGNTTSGSPIEYAYITPQDPDIHYKTQDGDIKSWPKKDLTTFMLNLYNNIIQELFNNRIDLKSKSSRPKFGLRISGSEINLIHFFIVNLGLIETLKFLGIKYQYGAKKAPGGFLHLKIKDPNINYLSIFTNGIKDEYMINGLRDGMKQVFPATKEEVESPNLYDKWLQLKGKSYAGSLRKNRINFIDNTTSKILKMYNIPNDIMELFGKYIPDYLLNASVSNYSDLKTQRVRMSESISHAAYKMLQQGISRVKNIKNSGNAGDIKLNLHSYEIVNQLQASGMLQYSQTANPLEELMMSTKITKTGVGNPLAQQIVLEVRDLNPSYYGVISPVSTNEYGNVGLTQTLANKATIVDRFGSIKSKEFRDDVNSFDLLSASESLQPFYEYDDTTRRVMGNQQFGQFVQLENGDEPLVQTGFEAVVPHLVSDRFAIKAKKVGQITKITKDDIIVKNQDGTQNKYSIRENRARTKRGIYIPMKYVVHAKEGQKIKPGQILASTGSLKTGKLAAGKNLVVAEMSYRGMNYEDGWVISEKIGDKYKNKIQEKLVVMIPTGSKIGNYDINPGQMTKPGDVLISFTNDSQFDIERFRDDESDTADDISIGLEYVGSFANYNSPGGEIKDVVVKLNDKNVDSKILQVWKKQAKDIELRKAECELVKHNQQEYVDCISGIEHTEILKIGGHVINGNEFEGAAIEIYIERDNPIAHGSKFTLAATGGKGTVQYIIPKDKTPTAVDTKLEIEFIPTPLSIIGRKNISILLLMYSGKVIYFMNKKIKELAAAGKIQDIRAMLLEIFSYMDESKDKFLVNETMAFFDSKSNNEIIKYIANSDPLNRPAFPLLVPPHKNKIDIKNIQLAANALEIPLNEKVRIPEEDGIVTEQAVPVGIMPVIYLEHFPKAMSGARGSLSVKRQFTTGQGRSGTRQGAGAIKLGFYDLFAMAYKEPGLLMKELHGIHADNKEGKSKFNREVLKTGEMPVVENIKIESSGSKTKQLVEVFFHGAMLKAEF